MYHAIHAYKVDKNQYIVGVIPRGKPARDIIAAIHSGVGATSYRLPVRRFLGMAQTTIDWANTRMQRWINENVRKAAHKYINLKY